MSKLRVLGGLSAKTFLDRHWQREPLMVRSAFPDLQDPLTVDELAGLACEPSVDSRLVLARGGTKPWQVIRGPQKPAALRKLGKRHWTLLVESVDRHDERVAAFARPFDFLPRWRMDDVMVSLSPAGGTVDAHIDSYDVFLIQGQGRRTWEVDRRAKPEYRSGLDLRILKSFRAEDSWTLDPGDMLYVPPGVAHRGVTVKSDSDVALTYSVGFRSPSSADMVSSLAARLIAGGSSPLYSDPRRRPAGDPFELGRADLVRLQALATKHFSDGANDDWILSAGEAVTAGGSSGRSVRASAGGVFRRLAKGDRLFPAAAARASWARLEGGRTALFINGESRVFSKTLSFFPGVICGQPGSPAAFATKEGRTLAESIAQMLRAGLLTWSEDRSR